MRVLQVIDKSFLGGGQQAVRHLIDGMHRKGASVSLTCRDGGPLVEAIRALGVNVHPIPFDKRFRPGPARAVAALARRVHAEVVHAHGLVATSYCVAARTLFGMSAPLLYHQHGFHHHNYGRATIGLRKQIERGICRRVDRVIAVSRADFDALLAGDYAAPPRLQLIDYGIEARVAPADDVAAAREAAGLPQGVPVVGFIGRLHQQKGIDTFLRAAEVVRRERPDAAFVIVGGGDLEGSMRALAEKLALRVHWIGAAPGERYLPLFTVAVLASRWEGMPLVLLEYMAAGLPIVATDLPNCRHAIDADQAALVPPDQPNAMAAAIIELLRCPDRARALGLAARARYLERFTLERMVRRFMGMYEEVLR
jgi:glycosyltransferase involved in cell wall biosynthesis